MTLQNRVTPKGEIVAVPERGSFMGNRGVLHDTNKQLGRRRWALKAWLICRLEFRGRDGSLTDLAGLDAAGFRRLRGPGISMIFQDPMTSLNPVFTVERQMGEGLKLRFGLGRAEARERSAEMLRTVGIADPEERLAAYPHELSGGMKQRVMIAMAMACQPDLLIADTTTALDHDSSANPGPDETTSERSWHCDTLYHA